MYNPIFKDKKNHVYHDITMLGHYLAGVWEGDGHIKKNKNSGKTTIHITMHKQQEVYAKQLLRLLNRLELTNNRIPKTDSVGSVHVRHDNNSCVLNIFTPHGLLLIVQLMGDKLKTPKALQLNNVIDWLNTHYNAKLNHVSFQSEGTFDLNTPWFAGFTDADGNFSIDLSTKTRLKVSCQFQINQRMFDPKTDNLRNKYNFVFNGIAQKLNVNLHTIMEKNSGRYYYVIKATSRKSKQVLRDYFDTYPLLTSKALDYKDWCAVDDLIKKKNNRKNLEQIQALKTCMNNNRNMFTWDHIHFL